jgi:hypothetical protein
MVGKLSHLCSVASVFAILAAGACGGSETPGGPGTSGGAGAPPGPTGTPTATPTAPTSTSTTPTPTPPSPANDVVRFVAMGDTGKGNQSQRDVAAAVAAKCQKDGCDFVQLLGDNIYDSGASSPTDSQFNDKFEIPYAAINLPFYVVLGNHDYGGGGTGNEFGKAKNEIDYTSHSSKWRLPAAYYKRTEKHVEFFALDTNMQMYSQDAQQKTDMKAWIGASTATWKIAIGHHPYKSNGPHGNAGSYDGLPFVPIANGAGVKSFLEEIVCGKVDVYLSGHDHSRQWIVDKCGGTTELIVSGAGAEVTDLKGSNPTHFQSPKIGFHYIKIEGRKLTAEFVDAKGNVEYTRTIQK